MVILSEVQNLLMDKYSSNQLLFLCTVCVCVCVHACACMHGTCVCVGLVRCAQACAGVQVNHKLTLVAVSQLMST